uniref:HDC19942 n=1 Tax=Drosophila melanogaster TaxID=7227 RepID=Q6II29_DROME|nr:TPA_inf: HDC19942 [Drosophila melanogaster]
MPTYSIKNFRVLFSPCTLTEIASPGMTSMSRMCGQVALPSFSVGHDDSSFHPLIAFYDKPGTLRSIGDKPARASAASSDIALNPLMSLRAMDRSFQQPTVIRVSRILSNQCQLGDFGIP